ncbi:MAG: hypothetical protein A3H31_08155 [Gallionellales bacterium RIFCSPLOWO2_02_FULL_57_47]|nr:MAG: hypothetical protein A3H31_08155 [Gallionellales bacterium RIFCSPLOWO2_02_FULL_57_47]
MLETIPPLFALILVEPIVSAVNNPVLSIVATAVLLDVQFKVPKVATVPSVRVPLAVNCSVFPNSMRAIGWVMESVASTGAVTARVALEGMPLRDAVMVALPCARVVAMPLAFSVATAVLPDVQVTEPETLPVLPSE